MTSEQALKQARKKILAYGDARVEEATAEQVEEIKDLQTQAANLMTQKAALAETIASQNTLIDSMNIDLDAAHAQIELLEERIRELEDDGASPTMMGVDWSTAKSPEPNYFTDWGALRVYTMGQVAKAHAAYAVAPSAVCVTDDPALPVGSDVGGALETALISWYESAGWEDRAHCEYHFGWRNEISAEYQSGSLPDAVVKGFAACRKVMDQPNPDAFGRRFPNARLYVDLTTNHITNGQAAKIFKPLAPYLDGLAASLYPPGRTKSPVEFTDYSKFIDPVLDCAADWGVPDFAIWETGSPVGNVLAKRGDYFLGLLDYVKAGCAVRGLNFTVACYWNRQKDGGPANQFKHDRSLAPNDTATKWNGWA